MLCLTAISISCRKDAGSPSTAPSRNEWTYAGTTLKAAFSETDIRGGYKITFRPAGDLALTHGISFQFSGKPATAGTFSTTRNLSGGNQVVVILETDTVSSYYSLGNDQSVLSTSIQDGKIGFAGENIRIVRDTVPSLADTLLLRFELREY